MKKALRQSLLRRAAAEVENRTMLTLVFDRHGLKGGELRVPGRVTRSPVASRPFPNLTHLLNAADAIGQKIVRGRKGAWRSAAREVGRDLYRFLKNTPAAYDLLVIGRDDRHLSACSIS